MSDALFQEAYARARNRFTEDAWLALHPRQITDAIYREIRQIDAERVAALGGKVAVDAAGSGRPARRSNSA